MIMVTGATGNVGREVVDLLLEGGEEVVAITRDPATAELPDGAHVVGGDPSHPTTLTSALPDVDAVLLGPRAVGNATAELLEPAADHGARRVVVLSAVTVEHPIGYRRFIEEFEAVEDAAKASGLAWTMLRCTDFATNTLVWAPQIRSTGVVRGAYGDAASSTIHPRDIAAVGVRALTDSAHAGQAYLLTGPHLLTQRDKVRLIGEATGTNASFEEIPPEQVRRAMLAQGLPEEIPERLLGSLADYAEQPGPSSDTVERILGRPALTFAQWAAEHAADFRS